MPRCWAQSLGNCSTTQSMEHYVSANLFDTGRVMLRGFAWCPGEFRIVGVNSAGANVLCSTHNNALSPLDAAAGSIRQTLSGMERVRSDREATLRVLGPRSGFIIKRYTISGNLLERWAIKCAIGLFSAIRMENELWSSSQTSPINPPDEIVNAAFGHSILQRPMGLWFAQGIGETATHIDGYTLSPLFHTGSTITDERTPDSEAAEGFVGVLITFLGFRFLIWLSPEPISPFSPEEGVFFGPGLDAPMYRPREFVFRQGGLRSQVLTFTWEDTIE